MTIEAIILAGGKGERLRPHSDGKPKPMVEVGGKPILAYQIEQLKTVGIETVVFACSYMKDVLIHHIGQGERYGITARFSIEETQLGRGGAIKKAMKKLPDDWQNVLVTNGDNLWQVNLSELIIQHINRNALATIVVVPFKSPYGIVEFNEKDEVEAFREKPVLPHWVNAGIYVFSKEIEPLLPESGDHEEETFPKLPRERFFVYRSRDYWRAVDTSNDLQEAEIEVGNIFPQR